MQIRARALGGSIAWRQNTSLAAADAVAAPAGGSGTWVELVFPLRAGLI